MLPQASNNFSRFGKRFVYVLAAVVVMAGAWEGFKIANLRLALARAHRDLSAKEYTRAEFWARRALGGDATNVEAMRLMAEINEARDKPVALAWRMEVAKCEPENTGDILAWAKSALRFGETDMAMDALKTLPRDFREKSADYHELMAGCALSYHETRIAEAHFAMAAELGIGDPVHAMNLAAFRLANAASPDARAAAGRDLEGMLSDARVSLFAARALLSDAIRNRDAARAQRLAEKLRSLPDHDLSDDLSCLETVNSKADFESALKEIERRAGTQVPWTAEAGEWLNSRGLASETVRWLGMLPQVMRSNIRIQMTLGEAYLALGNWTALGNFLAGCQWDDCEYLKRAMQIRCRRELSQPWNDEWKQLTAETQAHPPEAVMLAQLVIGWKWRDETLGLLWDAAARPGTDSKALQLLWNLYSRTNETGELLRVAKAQIALDPSNPIKKNNCAFLSLLVHGASPQSEQLAREASASNPEVPEWTATYAYALHLAGKDSEAKSAMTHLSSEALERPGIALYYAIVLAANGDPAHARESLAKLNPNGMLPEEQKLASDLSRQLRLASR